MCRFHDDDVDKGGKIWVAACEWEDIGAPVTEGLRRLGVKGVKVISAEKGGQVGTPMAKGDPKTIPTSDLCGEPKEIKTIVSYVPE